MKKFLCVLISFVLFLSITGVPVNAATDDVAIENTILSFYNSFYSSLYALKLGSYDDILDMSSIQSHNKVTSLQEIISRWVYLIETKNFSGKMKYSEVEFDFQTIQIHSDNTATVIVNIFTDDENYLPIPGFVSLGVNTFKLRKYSNKWLIVSHDYKDTFIYEGSLTEKREFNANKFNQELYAQVYEKTDDTLNVLINQNESMNTRAYPHTDYNYNVDRAKKYAKKYVYNANPYFYEASYDCTNFVSQCISYGFGTGTAYDSSSSYKKVNSSSYTSGWYAGAGGGSASWEIVSNHWTYMNSLKNNLNGPRVSSISFSGLMDGDVMQIDFTSDGTYDHTVFCYDASGLTFYQHSSNGIRTWADYSGTKRYYHPRYFREY